MQYAPEKIFVLEDGKYIEVDYAYYQRLKDENPKRRFWLFGGNLMEIPQEDYVQMNRQKSREQYLYKLSVNIGEISYDSLGKDELDGDTVIEDKSQDVCEIVEQKLMREKLHEAIKQLSDEEAELIRILFFENMSERKYSQEKGISHTAIQKKRQKALDKLRNIIGNID